MDRLYALGTSKHSRCTPFLSKALTTMRNWPPTSITTDKRPSYPQAIERLKRDGQLSEDTRHRTSKYLNNVIEADHGALKRVVSTHTRLSNDEDSDIHDQGLRDHAYDPAWSLSDVQAKRPQ
jgi:transposase-like protein